MRRCKMNKRKIATELGCDFLQLIHFGNALFTDVLVTILHKGAVSTAEDAGRLQFL